MYLYELDKDRQVLFSEDKVRTCTDFKKNPTNKLLLISCTYFKTRIQDGAL